MRYQDIKSGVELNEDLTPHKYSPELLLEWIVPWIAGFTLFCLMVTFISHLFVIWEWAPLFYITGFVISIVLSVMSIIVGLVVLLFSGSVFVFKNIPDLYSVAAYQTFTAFFFGILVARYTKNILGRIHIGKNVGIAILVISFIAFVFVISVESPSYLSLWLDNLFTLIESQFMKS